MQSYYPMWQDVHVMIYIGFGFLMVFLKTGSWTAVGFNYMLAAWAFQWGILCVGFWIQIIHSEEPLGKIHLDVHSLILGDFAAGSAMICFGAILGKADLFQCFIIVTIQMVFYGLNNAISENIYHAVDMGGSMIIHAFGAYFGLASTFFLHSKKAIAQHDKKCGGGYISQTVAMAGTIFLFLFWPSFNAALSPAISQQRVVVNTALSISASVIGACACARLMHSVLDMEVVLNATLAGGVIIGAASDVVVKPGVAIVIGGIGGMISAAGFVLLSGKLREKIGLHDTCGVHNLHGIPGFAGGLIGAVCSALGGSNMANKAAINLIFKKVAAGDRTFREQAGFQLASLFTAVGIAVLSGAFAGWVASHFGRPTKHLFSDKENWYECPANDTYVMKPDENKTAHSDLVKTH